MILLEGSQKQMLNSEIGTYRDLTKLLSVSSCKQDFSGKIGFLIDWKGEFVSHTVFGSDSDNVFKTTIFKMSDIVIRFITSVRKFHLEMILERKIISIV